MEQENLENKNPRRVLFEKSQVYYFETRLINVVGGELGVCADYCMVKESGVMIGSTNCSKCVHNKTYEESKNYILCSRIKEAIGK